MFGLFQNKKSPYSNVRGKEGEDIAEKFLKKAGYRILARNYIHKKGYRVGEIDIVAQEGEELVFVEVKARHRKGKYDLPPEMAVDQKKLERLGKSAYQYRRQERKELMRYRFDVVSIMYEPDGTVAIKQLKNVFL